MLARDVWFLGTLESSRLLMLTIPLTPLLAIHKRKLSAHLDLLRLNNFVMNPWSSALIFFH